MTLWAETTVDEIRSVVKELGQMEGAGVSAPLVPHFPSRTWEHWNLEPSCHALCLLTLATATIDVSTERPTFETAAAVEPMLVDNA